MLKCARDEVLITSISVSFTDRNAREVARQGRQSGQGLLIYLFQLFHAATFSKGRNSATLGGKALNVWLGRFWMGKGLEK